MIAVLASLLVANAHANRLLARYFDVRRPACSSHLDSTRERLPRLEMFTPSLKLRHARESDRAAMIRILNDPDILRWYLNGEWTLDLSYYFESLRDGVRVSHSARFGWTRTLRLSVTEKGRARPVGLALVQRAEASGRWSIGYALAGEVRGRGWGLELVEGLCAMIARADEGARVEAFVDERNTQSRKCLVRARFERSDEPVVVAQSPPRLGYVRVAASRDL